jgi:transcriptional regulator with XRE-family HTH domain
LLIASRSAFHFFSAQEGGLPEMGKNVRERPARLAEKLLHIRRALGLSQNEMIRQMGLTDEIVQQDISTYELNQREPPLRVLLEFAKAAAGSIQGAGDYLVILIDDSRDLPERLPDATPREKRIKTKRKIPS